MTIALTDRFWSKVTKDEATDCWLWTGALNSRGYGCWGVQGVSHLTHRLAYEALVGPIPDRLTLDHLCRVKACCNPAHLEPVTAAENIRRAGAAITHCPQGHEYTPDNTLTNGNGNRHCRECQNARRRVTGGRAAGAAKRAEARRLAHIEGRWCGWSNCGTCSATRGVA